MAGTTPIYGLPYPQSSDLVSAYPALGQDLAEDLDGILAAKANLASPALTGTPTAPTAANGTNTTQIATTAFVQNATAASGGLIAVTPSSIANSGGSATVSGQTVTFSSVTSVSLNGIFSATFDHYQINIQFSKSGANYVNVRLRASGTDASGANYAVQFLDANGGTGSFGSATNYNAVQLGELETRIATRCMMFGPFATGNTQFLMDIVAIGPRFQYRHGEHQLSTSYDGFSLIASAGTITGIITAYGFKR